jgi:hypothetical protein
MDAHKIIILFLSSNWYPSSSTIRSSLFIWTLSLRAALIVDHPPLLRTKPPPVRSGRSPNRFIAILKKLAASTMPAIKAHGMTGEQPAHHSGQGAIAATQQQVKMVGNQSPCKTAGVGIGQHLAQPTKNSCRSISSSNIFLRSIPLTMT